MGTASSLQDDSSIPDHELLFRGLLPQQVPGGEISGSAFKNRNKSDPHISVDRSSLTTAQETLRRLPKSVAIGQLQTGIARKHKPSIIGVISDPQPDPDPDKDNPAHALLVWSLLISEEVQDHIADELAMASTVVARRAEHP